MIDDSIKNQLQDATLNEHKRLYMVLYSLLQNVGSRFEEDGLAFIKKVINAGENGIKASDTAQINNTLVDFLADAGFIKKGEETITFNREGYINALGEKLKLAPDDMAEAGNASALFLDLAKQVTLDVALPRIRRDGVGLNRDFIFNRLRGHIRRNEQGVFKNTLVAWLV